MRRRETEVQFYVCGGGGGGGRGGGSSLVGPFLTLAHVWAWQATRARNRASLRGPLYSLVGPFSNSCALAGHPGTPLGHGVPSPLTPP